MSISAVIHIGNNEKTLEATLQSVAWADEIVVIDMESTDKSVEIAKKYTNKIYTHKNTGYVEPARNFGIGKATSEWVLILDADEEIPETLKHKLISLVDQTADVWKLPRKNIFFGHWLSSAGWWPDYQFRFFRKGSLVWSDKIHSQPAVTGAVEALPPEEGFAILHHNYASVSDFVSRLNFYTTITANETTREMKSPLLSFWQEFQRRFFQLEGHKGGELGLHASLLQSFYEAVTEMKAWEKNGNNAPIQVGHLLDMIQRDLAYWRADYGVKNAPHVFSKLYWQLRRKLKV